MTDWPDEKIRNVATRYVLQHASAPGSWRHTRLSEHPELRGRCRRQPGELAIVSSFISDSSWYALTTRRVVGAYRGSSIAVRATHVLEDAFGNFKGYLGAETETLTLTCEGMPDVQLEYETGKASMAPIYYFRFWAIKYPVLDKLKDDPG